MQHKYEILLIKFKQGTIYYNIAFNRGTANREIEREIEREMSFTEINTIEFLQRNFQVFLKK